MDAMRVVVVCLALVALAALPGLIAWAVVNADDAADRAAGTLSRLRTGTATHRPVEETTALLRSVSAQLVVTPPQAVTRRGELLDRYDALLREACAVVDVPQHLSRLTGMDAAIERLRLEGELERAGLVVRDPTDHDARGCT